MGKLLRFDNRKAKEIDQSKLFVAYMFGEGIDGYGRRFIRTKWVEVKEEINLGSSIKPNKEICLIKYIIPPT